MLLTGPTAIDNIMHVDRINEWLYTIPLIKEFYLYRRFFLWY